MKELQRLEVAEEIAERVYRRNAQVRRIFVGRERGTERPVPLAEILRGGRGGQVRLKLYLSLLWVAAAPPHDVEGPARTWAELLGLDDPEINGARRIRAATAWLEKRGFIRSTNAPGEPLRIVLLHESGSGKPYTLPGEAVREAQTSGTPLDADDHYLQIPSEFWTNGWITRLSGPAVAMLLVLIHAQRGRESREIWFSPSVFSDVYDLSRDTQGTGVRELSELGLVTVTQRQLSSSALGYRRVRNVHRLHLKALQTRDQQSLPSKTDNRA